MYAVNITSAKAHLSSLLKEVDENDEEIIIEKAGKPIARLIKYKYTKAVNRLGMFKDRIEIASDFDHWPKEIAIKLGIED